MGMLIVAVAIDYRSWCVPNKFIVLCSITSMYLLWTEMGVWGCPAFICRFLWPIVLLYPVYLVKGIGAGDIKLLAVVSTTMISQKMIGLILCSFIIGAVFGLLRWIKNRRLCLFYKQKSANYQTTKIHFTLCILCAFIECLIKEEIF